MEIDLITVPYDAARYNERMGRGPLHLVEAGIIQRLSSPGRVVSNKEIRSSSNFPTEISTTFDLLAQLSIQVANSINNRNFPLVLSGNCSSTIGVINGINAADVGIIWFDAHGDCETPETTTSGFFDGMGISMLTGHCWHNMLAPINGYLPVPEKKIVLIGARDLSEHERSFIEKAGIRYVTVRDAKEQATQVITRSIAQLKEQGVQKLHLHVDVDVLDPAVAVANSYAVPGGLDKESLFDIIEQFSNELPLISATVASYDPSFDVDGKMSAIILELADKVVSIAIQQ